MFTQNKLRHFIFSFICVFYLKIKNLIEKSYELNEKCQLLILIKLFFAF